MKQQSRVQQLAGRGEFSQGVSESCETRQSSSWMTHPHARTHETVRRVKGTRGRQVGANSRKPQLSRQKPPLQNKTLSCKGRVFDPPPLTSIHPLTEFWLPTFRIQTCLLCVKGFSVKHLTILIKRITSQIRSANINHSCSTYKHIKQFIVAMTEKLTTLEKQVRACKSFNKESQTKHIRFNLLAHKEFHEFYPSKKITYH